MSEPAKLFTLDEATALLPQVRDILLLMQDTKRQIDAVRSELERVARSSMGNGHVHNEEEVGAKRREAEALVERLNTSLATLNGWGVELKGIDEGLVDFPSEREGRIVYLCWRLGEDEIAWWHDIDAGFAGRKPL